ncbi:hypothetical protein Rahaq2_1667 [Rahnella aquatilis CIP 78.65 = ATCC 33071]|uniref:Uncharacterized protein n=1 Tax=Rahnella aquatilis (strain ATCC 33071 / DSM 4594 / JCM 1683 / NBRC 105701 / NCIMB 13365 / CIP 78.65) TaxID=745277 RepID=H2IT23_RAHAC|nr:hypothetical protein Rahaq2_1667 [Rahnella aquatilis CIP 78.65 = ATCC 33071]
MVLIDLKCAVILFFRGFYGVICNYNITVNLW